MTDTAERTTQSGTDADPPRRHSPAVVGIAASATAEGSLGRFFANFNLDDAQATVLVFQHREALDMRQLRQTLSRFDPTSVATVSDGGLIEGGKIYLCPPDMITTIQ